MKKFILSISFTISLILSTPSYCQQADSLKHTSHTIPKWHQTKVFRTVAVPSLLAGYGFTAMGKHGFPYSSYEAYRDIRQHFPNFHTNVDNLTAVLPGLAVYGLNLAGVKGKHNFVDQTILYGLSSALALGTVLILKGNVPYIRPDSSNYYSFPSGHTAEGFVSAEFMHQELKEVSVWYSIAGYSFATATGAMRMLNNRHWLSDVLVGAGIGMFYTKLVYLVYPFFQQKINHGKQHPIGFMPFYNGRMAGFVFICLIR